MRGRSAPTMFFHTVTDVRAVVHGNDFTFDGKEVEVRKVQTKVCEWYDVKMRGLWEVRVKTRKKLRCCAEHSG